MDESAERLVRVLIVVDSWMGHTEKVAGRVAEGIRSEGGRVTMRSADEAKRADLRAADALVMGSAVHQRGMTWKMKRFVDEVCEPAWFYDDLVGRVGAVFTAGWGHGQAGGGCEMAQLGMLANLAACGMVLLTLPKTTPGFERAGMHWGPTIKATTDTSNPSIPVTWTPRRRKRFFITAATSSGSPKDCAVLLSPAATDGLRSKSGRRAPARKPIGRSTNACRIPPTPRQLRHERHRRPRSNARADAPGRTPVLLGGWRHLYDRDLGRGDRRAVTR